VESVTLSRGQKRRLHTRLLAQLILEMRRRGYEVSLSEGYVGDSIDKPHEDSPHRRDGGHFKGIAVDVNLHKCRHVPAHDFECPSPEYLTATAAHEPFGVFWEGLHPLARWGGRFRHPDGTHYSLEDGGVA
jgi:hypothetical protein